MYATAAVTVLLVAAVFASNAAPTDIGELGEYPTDDYAVRAPRLLDFNTTKDPASSDFTTTYEDPPASSDSTASGPPVSKDDGTTKKVAVNDLTASAEEKKKAPKTDSSVKPNVWDVISEDGCTTLLGIVGHHVPALESSLLELTGLVLQQPVHQRRLLKKALTPIWELVVFMRSVHKATRDYIGAQSFGAQSFTAADSSDSSSFSSAEPHISLPDAVVIIEDTLRHTTLPGKAAVDVVENILMSLESLKNYAVLHKVEEEMELLHEQQTAGGLQNFPGFVSINAADAAAAAAAAVGRKKRDGDSG